MSPILRPGLAPSQEGRRTVVLLTQIQTRTLLPLEAGLVGAAEVRAVLRVPVRPGPGLRQHRHLPVPRRRQVPVRRLAALREMAGVGGGGSSGQNTIAIACGGQFRGWKNGGGTLPTETSRSACK